MSVYQGYMTEFQFSLVRPFISVLIILGSGGAVAEEGDSVDTGAVGVGTLSFLDPSELSISSFL